MTEVQPIGVALWGVGEHARRNVLPALAACPAVRLVGLFTRNVSVRAVESEKWGCRAFADPDEMLADAAVAAVYVSTPVAFHHDHGLRVLAAGRHLWGEKPLAASLADTEALIALSRRADRAACEVLMYVHHRQFKTIKSWLAEGRIGAIRRIAARFGFLHLDPGNIRYRPDMGGGALLDAAIYPLSAALLLAGEDPATVAARIEHQAGYAVDTGGTARLLFPSGLEALCEWGFGRPYQAEIEVSGEKGTLFAARAFSKPADFAASLMLRRPEGETETVIGADNHFVAMLTAFAATTADPALRAAERDGALARARLLARVLAAA